VVTSRKPCAVELARAFVEAGGPATPFLAMRAEASAARPKLRTGDVLRIPYSNGGGAQIYGRALFGSESRRKDDPRRGPGLGACVVVYDLDAPANHDVAPEVLLASPILFGPFHVGDAAVREGRWQIAFSTAVGDDELPTFAVSRARSGAFHRVVTDYFDIDIEDTPETRGRVAEASIVPDSMVVTLARMLRGQVRFLKSYAEGMNVRGR
jgi:hypothetical protein